MKRFRFPLQKVLRLREQETEQAKRALAVAIQSEMNARHQLEAAVSAVAEEIHQLGRRESEALPLHNWAQARTFLAGLYQNRVEAERALAQAVDLTAELRAMLVAARRGQRALEMLRERRWEQYQQESLREEQRELDEYGNRPALTDGVTNPT